MSAARAHRQATAQPPLTGRKRSGPLRLPRRTKKARFIAPIQRDDRRGKVRTRRKPCPIRLKYDDESSPHPRRTLWLLSCHLRNYANSAPTYRNCRDHFSRFGGHSVHFRDGRS